MSRPLSRPLQQPPITSHTIHLSPPVQPRLVTQVPCSKPFSGLHGPQNKGDAFSQAFKTFLNLVPANLSSWIFLRTHTPSGQLVYSPSLAHTPTLLLPVSLIIQILRLECPPLHLYLSNPTWSSKPSSGVTSSTKLPTLSTWERRDIFTWPI